MREIVCEVISDERCGQGGSPLTVTVYFTLIPPVNKFREKDEDVEEDEEDVVVDGNSNDHHDISVALLLELSNE